MLSYRVGTLVYTGKDLGIIKEASEDGNSYKIEWCRITQPLPLAQTYGPITIKMLVQNLYEYMYDQT